jgi:glutamate-1-semialdehyde 2,1-aminomutase
VEVVKVLGIVQARLESTRFPNKILAKIGDKPLLEFLLDRLKLSKTISQIIVALPNTEANRNLAPWIESLGFSAFYGNNEDVLDRYFEAAVSFEAEVIVRITADCPLVDPEIVDKVVSNFLENPSCGISTNTHPPTFPDGFDCSVFSKDSLELAFGYATNKYDREHVTPYLYRKYKDTLINHACENDYSNLRVTIDEKVDLEVVSSAVKLLGESLKFTCGDVIGLYKNNPEIFYLNSEIIRNEGAIMNEGQKLYKRAISVIPGGTMLFSKKPENFLPKVWPTYYSKAKGCEIWNLEGQKFIDVSMMGIGTNPLGYANDEIDEAVVNAIRLGNMSTLNSPEEVYLAEKLIQIHPWASQVRFARTGGEASSIAIRISRASTGKDKIAFCGYHGWHDWYISANIENSLNLASHLMDGLDSKGVPKVLIGSSVPFVYNDIDSFNRAIEDDDIGTVIMEVMRNIEPDEGFLEYVRAETERRGINLIFDECTSGFRETFGGLHKRFQVIPDIAIFGKALGNGYAITSVVGNQKIMKYAQESFISSTFWTERSGSVAALKTLEIMERDKTWETIQLYGKTISAGWSRLAEKYNLNVTIFGLDSMIKIKLLDGNNQIFKTFLTQEMLKEGYLATTQFNASMAHSDEIIENYLICLEKVFCKFSETMSEGQPLMTLIDNELAHSDFKRLN